MPLYNPPTLTVAQDSSTTCNKTTVAVPATIANDAEVIAANPARKSLTLWNKSTGSVKVEKGAAPTADSFTADIAPNGYFEFPQPIWRGAVRGLWSAAGGTGLLVREDV